MPDDLARAAANKVMRLCGRGERAGRAASVLRRTGHCETAVLSVGPKPWAQDSGNIVAVSG
ncbi:MAG: hypothetical protein NVS3B26_26490 [Mycobacteriales bacterium]